AYAFPNQENHFSKWWSTLFNQAFFAPLYLMMIWITVEILNGDGLKAILNPIDATGTPISPSTLQIVMHFIIVITFMFASIIVAKTLGAKGADVAMSSGKKWLGRAQGAVVGATVGLAGKQTIGRLAYGVGESGLMKKAVAWSPRIGGTLKKIADYGSGTTFGAKAGFKRALEEKAKIPDYIKKDPALLAKYIKNLQLPVVGGGLRQKVAYEKLKPEERVKISGQVDKMAEQIKTRSQIADDLEKLDAKNKELSLWYNNTPDSIKLIPTNAEKLEQYKKYRRDYEQQEKLMESAPKTPEELEVAKKRVGEVLRKLEARLPDPEKEKLNEAKNKKRNEDNQKKYLKVISDRMVEIEKANPETYATIPEYQELLNKQTILLKNKEKPPEKESGGEDKEKK
ncbi:MAG: hypothetical protein AAB505_00570, partial [Patescibacteria group bacterium]